MFVLMKEGFAIEAEISPLQVGFVQSKALGLSDLQV